MMIIRFTFAQVQLRSGLISPDFRFASSDLKNEPGRKDESERIRSQKEDEKGLQPIGHRSVEFGFGLCLQPNARSPVGVPAERLGRGPQEDCRIAKIGNRRNWKSKSLTTKDAKEHKGAEN
jgi:hypothetical protein